MEAIFLSLNVPGWSGGKARLLPAVRMTALFREWIRSAVATNDLSKVDGNLCTGNTLKDAPDGNLELYVLLSLQVA